MQRLGFLWSTTEALQGVSACILSNGFVVVTEAVQVEGGPLHSGNWVVQRALCKRPPIIFLCELQAPMGACSRQYGRVFVFIVN